MTGNIVRKFFYGVCILSSVLLCLFSQYNYGNYGSEEEILKLNLKTATHQFFRKTDFPLDKLADLVIENSTLPLKNTIKIALEEIETFSKSIPTQNSKVNIFLATTWRSGSTFLGEALSAHEAIFYHYEPLSLFGFQNLHESNMEDVSLKMLKSLSQCQYTNLDQYLDWVKNNDTEMLTFNNKISRACNFLGSNDCTDVNFLSKACSYFPIQLVKVVRLSVAAFENLVKEDTKNHVIVLARDPRAILASRMKLKWCMENPQCGEPRSLCQSLNEDQAATMLLKTQYPRQIHLVKYEDLAQNPLDSLRKLFNDLKIAWSTRITDYIKTHTTSNLEEPWSTFRISKLRINHWKSTLDSLMIGHVQQECEEFMKSLNYSKIDIALCDKFC